MKRLLLVMLLLAITVSAETTRAKQKCGDLPGDTGRAKLRSCIAVLPKEGGTADFSSANENQVWDANPFADLADAKYVRLVLGPGVLTVTATTIVPHNVTLNFSQGGIIEVKNCELVIHGTIQAGVQQHIFRLVGSGKVIFDRGTVVQPSWVN